MKISAALIAWNEVDTLDLCLRSLKGFVDEVIIADNGSFDGTQKKAEECLSEYGLSGEVLTVKANTLGQGRLAAIENCTYDWILLIDANLVLSDALKKELLDGQKRTFISMIRSLNLMGDYEHYFTPLPLHDHHEALFHKSMVTWPDDYDRPLPHYHRLRLKRWAVNLSRVRPSWRCWYRGEPFDPETGREWQTEGNIQHKWIESRKHSSPLDYIQATEKMSLHDVKVVAPEWFLGLLQKFAKPMPPRFRRWLPEPIQEEQRDPRYRLIYQGGEIIGRWPKL